MTTSAVPESIQQSIEYYKELLENPVVTRASFGCFAQNSNLILETSHRSVTHLTKRSATQTLFLDPSTDLPIALSPVAFSSSEVVHTSYAPDGKTAAHFREIKSPRGKAQRSVEIWNISEGRMLEELDVTKNHGAWYFDATFGGVSWHSSSQSLVYTAEGIPPSTVSKFDYTPDFGEKFRGKRFPSLFLLLLKESPFQLSPERKIDLHQLTGPGKTDDGISFGQAVFLPEHPRPRHSHITGAEGSIPCLLATGYSSLPDGRKLGIIACTNRPSAIYELSLAPSPSEPSSPDVSSKWECMEATQQSPVGLSCRSPRVLAPARSAFSPLVVFLASPQNGPHQSCTSLYVAQPSQRKLAELVPIVHATPKLDSDFPGLFVGQLLKDPFVSLDGYPGVVLSTTWRSRIVPVLVSLKTGSVSTLNMGWPRRNDDEVGLPYLGIDAKAGLASLTVLGTDGGRRIAGVRSSSNTPEEVVVMTLGPSREWKVVKKSAISDQASNALANLDWTVLPLPKFEPTEIILLSPSPINPATESRINLPPLITVPHGGPHLSFTTAFSPKIAALALAGYRVALVNYPGTVGFGQDAIDALAPELGKLDVQATLATSHYLNTLSLSSRTKGKNLLMGTSHGGYIAAHLSGQNPTSYDAVVLRNPVVDFPSMFSGTDIPDWIFNEGAPSPSSFYSYDSPPQTISPTLFSHLQKLSPLSRASEVIVPTLVMIGKNDRRVPNDQGRAWFHALKKNGKGEVAMCAFEGNGHGLADTVEGELGNFEEGIKWLGRFTEF